MRRVSSAVERHAYTVLVGGSNPSPSSAPANERRIYPTSTSALLLQRYQNYRNCSALPPDYSPVAVIASLSSERVHRGAVSGSRIIAAPGCLPSSKSHRTQPSQAA